jgi:hypothetical protein
MATYPPVPPPAPLPPPKKSNVLKWVLIGIAACFMLFVIAVVGLGLFVAQKAKQAGLDPDLIKRSPALAAAKMVVAANPDVEMVTADEGKQEMTVRDKKTGKVYTMSFEDAKNGKFTMTENGKTTLTVGGKAKAPTWVPDYPGSDPQGAFSAQGEDGAGGTFTFKTKDSSDKVIKYYQDQFKASGLTVTSNITSQNGLSAAGMLGAQDETRKHTVTVIVGVEGGETNVAVTYARNK